MMIDAHDIDDDSGTYTDMATDKHSDNDKDPDNNTAIYKTTDNADDKDHADYNAVAIIPGKPSFIFKNISLEHAKSSILLQYE